MKLTVTLTFYSPYISGLTLYAKRLSEAFVREKIETTVLTMKHDKNLKTREKINGVRVLRANVLKALSKGFLSWDFMLKSGELAAKTDCLIINLPQAEGIFPALFFKLKGKKIISVYHCEVILPRGTFNKIIQFLLNLSNFLSLLLSDTVITYTRDFAVHARLLAPFQQKIKTVYPPIIEPKIDNRVKKEIRRKIGQKQQFIIGIAARLAAEKGAEYLLAATPFLEEQLGKEFKIVFAGSMDPVGEKNYKRKIMQLVDKYKDKVVFLGEIANSKMGSFYSLLDILVLPSVNSTEAFGMVQVEAMMMGVPVVSCDLPGVRIPLKETGMGLTVPPKSTEKLARAIAEVLQNRQKYLKGKDKARKIFKISKTIDFYLQILNEQI